MGLFDIIIISIRGKVLVINVTILGQLLESYPRVRLRLGYGPEIASRSPAP